MRMKGAASGGRDARRVARRAVLPELEIVLLDNQRKRRIDRARLRGVLQSAADAMSVGGSVSLVLTGDRTVRRLNRDFRGKDKPTDVLSFPGPREEGNLGDIVISVETAARNAPSLARTLAQELDILALHGFLHVLGYDHETDDGTMDRLEARLRRRLLRGRA